MVRKDDRLEKLRKQRKKALALAPVMKEMHELLLTDYKALGCGINHYVKEVVRGTWGSIRAFIQEQDGEYKPLVGDGAIGPIADRLGRPDLAEKVRKHRKGLEARFVGLTLFPKELIELFFDLGEARLSSLDVYPRVPEFAAQFGSHQDLVQGIIKGKKESAVRLRDPVVARALREVLDPSLKGTSRPAEINLPQGPLGLAEIMAAFGGATLADGTRFVLTSDSFTPHGIKVGKDFIALARMQIEITRAVLNFLAQHKDSVRRGEDRKALAREVEELYQTIELFSFAIPNNLLPLIEGQRNAWENINPGSGPQGKGRRKKKGRG